MNDQNFKNQPLTKLISFKFLKFTNFFHKICKLFVVFYNVYKEKMITIEIEDGREPPESLVY